MSRHNKNPSYKVGPLILETQCEERTTSNYVRLLGMESGLKISNLAEDYGIGATPGPHSA